MLLGLTELWSQWRLIFGWDHSRVSVVTHAVTKEPLSTSSLFLSYQTPLALILLASNPMQVTIPKTLARGSMGSIYLKEEKFSVCMTTIPRGRKRNSHKLEARGVIFALNHLEEVLKGNIIPHLNFFLLAVFIILSWWEEPCLLWRRRRMALRLRVWGWC